MNGTIAKSLGIAFCIIGFSSPSFAGHTNHVLKAKLDGGQMVGTEGDGNGRGEAYVFGIDGDPKTLCYVVEVEDIQTVPVKEGMAAHIHEARKGMNGSPVAVLAGPEDGDAADCLTEGEKGKFPTGEAGIVQRILANPDDFYINVHNPEHPAGAIRGQLHGQHDMKM